MAARPPVLLGRGGDRQAFDRLLEHVRGGPRAARRAAQEVAPA